jgi:hypothetical protein
LEEQGELGGANKRDMGRREARIKRKKIKTRGVLSTNCKLILGNEDK